MHSHFCHAGQIYVRQRSSRTSICTTYYPWPAGMLLYDHEITTESTCLLFLFFVTSIQVMAKKKKQTLLWFVFNAVSCYSFFFSNALQHMHKTMSQNKIHKGKIISKKNKKHASNNSNGGKYNCHQWRDEQSVCSQQWDGRATGSTRLTRPRWHSTHLRPVHSPSLRNHNLKQLQKTTLL